MHNILYYNLNQFSVVIKFNLYQYELLFLILRRCIIVYALNATSVQVHSVVDFQRLIACLNVKITTYIQWTVVGKTLTTYMKLKEVLYTCSNTIKDNVIVIINIVYIFYIADHLNLSTFTLLFLFQFILTHWKDAQVYNAQLETHGLFKKNVSSPLKKCVKI